MSIERRNAQFYISTKIKMPLPNLQQQSENCTSFKSNDKSKQKFSAKNFKILKRQVQKQKNSEQKIPIIPLLKQQENIQDLKIQYQKIIKILEDKIHKEKLFLEQKFQHIQNKIEQYLKKKKNKLLLLNYKYGKSRAEYFRKEQIEQQRKLEYDIAKCCQFFYDFKKQMILERYQKLFFYSLKMGTIYFDQFEIKSQRLIRYYRDFDFTFLLNSLIQKEYYFQLSLQKIKNILQTSCFDKPQNEISNPVQENLTKCYTILRQKIEYDEERFKKYQKKIYEEICCKFGSQLIEFFLSYNYYQLQKAKSKVKLGLAVLNQNLQKFSILRRTYFFYIIKYQLLHKNFLAEFCKNSHDNQNKEDVENQKIKNFSPNDFYINLRSIKNREYYFKNFIQYIQYTFDNKYMIVILKESLKINYKHENYVMCYKLCLELLHLVCTFDTFQVILQKQLEQESNLECLRINESYLNIHLFYIKTIIKLNKKTKQVGTQFTIFLFIVQNSFLIAKKIDTKSKYKTFFCKEELIGFQKNKQRYQNYLKNITLIHHQLKIFLNKQNKKYISCYDVLCNLITGIKVYDYDQFYITLKRYNFELENFFAQNCTHLGFLDKNVIDKYTYCHIDSDKIKDEIQSQYYDNLKKFHDIQRSNNGKEPYKSIEYLQLQDIFIEQLTQHQRFEIKKEFFNIENDSNLINEIFSINLYVYSINAKDFNESINSRVDGALPIQKIAFKNANQNDIKVKIDILNQYALTKKETEFIQQSRIKFYQLQQTREQYTKLLKIKQQQKVDKITDILKCSKNHIQNHIQPLFCVKNQNQINVKVLFSKLNKQRFTQYKPSNFNQQLIESVEKQFKNNKFLAKSDQSQQKKSQNDKRRQPKNVFQKFYDINQVSFEEKNIHSFNSSFCNCNDDMNLEEQQIQMKDKQNIFNNRKYFFIRKSYQDSKSKFVKCFNDRENHDLKEPKYQIMKHSFKNLKCEFMISNYIGTTNLKNRVEIKYIDYQKIMFKIESNFQKKFILKNQANIFVIFKPSLKNVMLQFEEENQNRYASIFPMLSDYVIKKFINKIFIKKDQLKNTRNFQKTKKKVYKIQLKKQKNKEDQTMDNFQIMKQENQIKLLRQTELFYLNYFHPIMYNNFNFKKCLFKDILINLNELKLFDFDSLQSFTYILKIIIKFVHILQNRKVVGTENFKLDLQQAKRINQKSAKHLFLRMNQIKLYGYQLLINQQKLEKIAFDMDFATQIRNIHVNFYNKLQDQYFLIQKQTRKIEQNVFDIYKNIKLYLKSFFYMLEIRKSFFKNRKKTQLIPVYSKICKKSKRFFVICIQLDLNIDKILQQKQKIKQVFKRFFGQYSKSKMQSFCQDKSRNYQNFKILVFIIINLMIQFQLKIVSNDEFNIKKLGTLKRCSTIKKNYFRVQKDVLCNQFDLLDIFIWNLQSQFRKKRCILRCQDLDIQFFQKYILNDQNFLCVFQILFDPFKNLIDSKYFKNCFNNIIDQHIEFKKFEKVDQLRQAKYVQDEKINTFLIFKAQRVEDDFHQKLKQIYRNETIKQFQLEHTKYQNIARQSVFDFLNVLEINELNIVKKDQQNFDALQEQKYYKKNNKFQIKKVQSQKLFLKKFIIADKNLNNEKIEKKQKIIQQNIQKDFYNVNKLMAVNYNQFKQKGNRYQDHSFYQYSRTGSCLQNPLKPSKRMYQHGYSFGLNKLSKRIINKYKKFTVKIKESKQYIIINFYKNDNLFLVCKTNNTLFFKNTNLNCKLYFNLLQRMFTEISLPISTIKTQQIISIKKFIIDKKVIKQTQQPNFSKTQTSKKSNNAPFISLRDVQSINYKRSMSLYFLRENLDFKNCFYFLNIQQKKYFVNYQVYYNQTQLNSFMKQITQIQNGQQKQQIKTIQKDNINFVCYFYSQSSKYRCSALYLNSNDIKSILNQKHIQHIKESFYQNCLDYDSLDKILKSKIDLFFFKMFYQINQQINFITTCTYDKLCLQIGNQKFQNSHNFLQKSSNFLRQNISIYKKIYSKTIKIENQFTRATLLKHVYKKQYYLKIYFFSTQRQIQFQICDKQFVEDIQVFSNSKQHEQYVDYIQKLFKDFKQNEKDPCKIIEFLDFYFKVDFDPKDIKIRNKFFNAKTKNQLRCKIFLFLVKQCFNQNHSSNQIYIDYIGKSIITKDQKYIQVDLLVKNDCEINKKLRFTKKNTEQEKKAQLNIQTIQFDSQYNTLNYKEEIQNVKLNILQSQNTFITIQQKKFMNQKMIEKAMKIQIKDMFNLY